MKPAEAAKACGVTVNTIRNWCKEYGKEFLSPGAQPVSGNRELTGRDLEVLKEIARLRKEEKLQEPQIIQRLREKHFGEIEQPEITPANEPAALQESLQASLVPAELVLEAMRSLEARLVALEQGQQATDERIVPIETQRLRLDVTVVAVGAFVAGLIVGLAVWWFQ